MVYEPREDTFLLAAACQLLARGKVLEVGTGSGYIAKELMNSPAVTSVLACDIDPDAVHAAKSIGVHAFESDMFSAVDGIFDTIVCNTPYLPDEPLARDIALDGGPKGFEWTKRFLGESVHHLDRHGSIIFLISSLTNTGVIEAHMRELALEWEVARSEELFGETLFVYRAFFALPDRPSAVFLASGKRGRVYRDGDVVIKKASSRRIAQEALMLQKVNALGIGPCYKSHTKDLIVMEFIDGVAIHDFLSSCTQRELEVVLLSVLEQARRLDDAGIEKREMTNPYKHIIVRQGAPVLIDFERARYSIRPGTLAQTKEYVSRIARKYPQWKTLCTSLLSQSL